MKIGFLNKEGKWTEINVKENYVLINNISIRGVPRRKGINVRTYENKYLNIEKTDDMGAILTHE